MVNRVSNQYNMYALRDVSGAPINNLKWNKEDSNWSKDLINQIPFSIKAMN